MIALPSSLTIKQFDDHRWIVNTPDGRNILMNERAIGLLKILSGSSSSLVALEKFQKHFHQNITKEEFEGLVQNTFKGLNILSGQEGTPFKKSSYLTLKVPLLNARIAGWLASPFSILFRSFFFWPSLISAFFLNAIVSVSFFRQGMPSITTVDVILTSILVGASMLIHELGHIAACRQFGIKHGAIGFGFYFVFPVVYADITKVWNATKTQRIIANAGGIYTELIYSSVLLLFYAFTKDNTFLLASFTIFIKAATELNPFLRCDGYWLLSDITNTPNLMQRSSQALRELISIKTSLKNYGRLTFFKERRSVLLMFYGLANTLLLTWYLIYVVVNFHVGILQFPFSLFLLFHKALSLNISLSDIPNGFFWILGFYFLFGKIIGLRVVRRLKLLKK